MRRLSVFVCAFVLCIAMAVPALAEETFAARGSAVVSGLDSFYNSATSLGRFKVYLTNVSGGNVTCKVTVRDHDGTDVSEYCRVLTGSATGTSTILVSEGAGEFVIPAGGTRRVAFGGLSTVPGFLFCSVLVEWTSDDPLIRKALAGSVNYTQNVGSGTYLHSQMAINGGQLF